MRKIIHRLRQKSEEEKKHLLYIFTFIGAIVLIILWVFTLRQHLKDSDLRQNLRDDLEPFKELQNDLVEINSQETDN